MEDQLYELLDLPKDQKLSGINEISIVLLSNLIRMKKIIVLILFLILGCNKYKNPYAVITKPNKLDFWHLKDFNKDSIPGISLNKAYKTFLQSKKGNDVIIAIIDTDINTNHEDLKNNIWVNPKEVLSNGIDDDKNGYIDDVNGWNYLRKPSGERIIYTNYSHIGIIRKYDPRFKDKEIEEVGVDTINFKHYQRALKYYKKRKKKIQSNYEQADFLINTYPKGKKAMDSLFKKSDYTIEETDSVYFVYEKSNPTLANNAAFMYDYIKYDMEGYADELLVDTKAIEEIVNNINVNPKTNNDHVLFGSPIINEDLEMLTHGTSVTGVISANRINNKGVVGITNNIKIMTLSIQARIGADDDKNLSLAIRYAVDNGAKVINYSAINDFSINSEWVQDALKYAEKKDVLFIRAAGNSSQNLDSIHKYPNNKYNLSNFLIVSAINNKLDSNFKPIWANYGKNTVDLFAPGVDIATTKSNGKYHLDTGTSMATPMVVGVAALIKAYYPTLTMVEIKDIILQTVDTYNVDIIVKNKPKKIIPFSNLSKSGGVLNAYNAMVLAEKRVLN